MSEHDDRLPMLQMLEHTREAVSLVSMRRREDLDADRLLRLALERLVEIVGEAANRVSAATQKRFVKRDAGAPGDELRDRRKAAR